MKNVRKIWINKGCNALFILVNAELRHADDEKSHDQFDDAESTIDRYLEAAEQRKTDMPVVGDESIPF